MGVTSIVAGNCGGSALDVGAALERAAADARVGELRDAHRPQHRAPRGDGHARTARRRSASSTKMKALVWKAMADGAVGFSTGLQYVPGTYSKTPEIIELARVAANAGGLYASHMRNEGTALEAVRRGDDSRRRGDRRARADLAPEGRQPEPLGREREGAGADRRRAQARHRRRGRPVRLHRGELVARDPVSRPGRSKAASRRSPSG